MTVRDRLRGVSAGLRELYEAPYRRTLSGARRDEDDLFTVVVLAEALGVPNPASYYTVELLPLVAERVHEWHTRMGMDRSPLEHVSCC
ncbi:cory-CC-star protein [Isoptericola sp. BMS4]|uniref:cory-CC-star protein n=1 Tax=Isoptericola sp. BMS4 TaxID=2527875 RepID=UPI00196AA0BD|nr:cory-CC-star protein [Isoptericola sp. BMS4]